MEEFLGFLLHPFKNFMPNFFPEGIQAATGDDEARSYKKWNEQLFNTYGNVGRVPFPEGTWPSAADDEERSAKKVNAILKAVHNP